MIAIVGASGSGQVHAPQHPRRPRFAVGRAARSSPGTTSAGWARRERTAYRRRTCRGRLAADRPQPAALPLGGRERRAADGARRRARARRRATRAARAGRPRCTDAGHRPERLSGGEQQRVAIAVALANRPSVILADEPTGELDSQTSAEVFGLLRHVNQELGTTIVIVTHDPLVADQVQRTVAIRDGRTSSETLRRTELTDDGHRIVAEEFAVLDRAGRLQLPKAHIESLQLADRVRLRLEEDHVGVWPDRHSAGARGATAAVPERRAPAAAAVPERRQRRRSDLAPGGERSAEAPGPADARAADAQRPAEARPDEPAPDADARYRRRDPDGDVRS